MEDKVGVVINNQTHFLPIGTTAGQILRYLRLPDGYKDGIYYFVDKRIENGNYPPGVAKLYINGKTGIDLQELIFPLINLSYVPNYEWFHVHKNEVAIEENGDEFFILICKRNSNKSQGVQNSRH